MAAALTQDAQDEQIVLESMYTVGTELIKVEDRTFKLKATPYDEHELKSLWLRFTWKDDYPNTLPEVSVDLPENSSLSKAGKAKLNAALAEQAETMVGMPMTTALAEYLKQSWIDLLTPETLLSKATNLWESLNDPNKAHDDAAHQNVKKPAAAAESRTHMTKAAKRKEAARTDYSQGEKPRGWNWVDVISHLSKVGTA